MLTDEQIEVIRRYVPEEFFSQEKLIRYLTIHDIVGVEVFNYVAKKCFKSGSESFRTALPVMFEDSWQERTPEELATGIYFEPVRYEAESIDTFVRRIPFNFHHPLIEKRKNPYFKDDGSWVPVSITNFTYAVGEDSNSDPDNHRETPLQLEDMYQKLEFLFYNQKIPLEKIFAYPELTTEMDKISFIGNWFDYMDMCFSLGWTDYMPDNFNYRYNLARECLGKKPIMFYPEEFFPDIAEDHPEKAEYFQRQGNRLEIHGTFPCNEKGEPVWSWIGLDIQNPVNINCRRDDYFSRLTVTLGPKTVVRGQIPERDENGKPIDDNEPEWVQFYAGPQNMKFKVEVLKTRRKELGYTQQQVADAIEANVRTYQKWENGETQPDGYYLLRIMNWLDIRDVNDLIVYGRE